MNIPEYIEIVSDYNQLDIEKLKTEFAQVEDLLTERKRPDSPVLIQKALTLYQSKEHEILKTIPYTRKIIRHIMQIYSFNTVCYRCVMPDTCYSWHVDSGNMCMHIPLTTNPGCRFVYEDKSFFMPADGSLYAVNTVKYHSFMNGGSTPRTHITFENFK